MDMFKPDTEYSCQIELLPDRDIPKGHEGFGFTEKDTEVDALTKILDKYIDVSDINKAVSFCNHKIDFSVTFLDSLIIILSDKKATMQAYYEEVDKQHEAINHRMIKPYVDGRMLTNEEKLEVYNMLEKLLVERRNLKDAIALLKVNIENLEKSRNFILGMNQRKYTPKTERFKNDSRFQLGKSKENNKLEPVDTSVATVSTVLHKVN